MAMRIFLTGINGFLGRHVALKLNYAGHEVLGLVRSDVRKDCLSGLPIEYCEGDLLDAGLRKIVMQGSNLGAEDFLDAQFERNAF